MLRGAWALWRGREARRAERQEGAAEAPKETVERPYRRALVVSLLNPKAILFFISFFVQFVDPSYAHPVLSFLTLGAWAQLFSFTYLSVLIFSGTFLAATFRRRKRLTAGLSAGAGRGVPRLRGEAVAGERGLTGRRAGGPGALARTRIRAGGGPWGRPPARCPSTG